MSASSEPLAAVPAPASLYPWARALASLALMTLGGAGLYVSVVALKPVAAEFEVTRSAASLAYAATSVGFGVGGILMGWLSDRVGVMWPALLGAGCLALGLALAGSASDLWQYVLAHLFIGLLGNSAVMVPLVADITRWFSGNRGMAVAVVISGNYLAGAVWPAIVQHGIGTVGWRATYLWLAAVCLLGMVPLVAVLWRRAEVETLRAAAGGDARPRPLRLPPVAAQSLLCAAGVGCCVAMAMPQAHIVAHATDLGHPSDRAAQMLALMLGFGIVSRLGFGWLSDRIGGLRTALVGSLMQAVVLASFIPLTGLSALLWASALFGLSQGGIVPAYAIIIGRHFPTHEIGRRVGLVMLSTLIGMALGAWMAGVLYDLTGSYRAAFVNAVAFNVLNVAILLGLLARTGFARMT